MRFCQFLIICVLALAGTVSGQTPASGDVHVKLSLAQDRTVYRIGEPIGLALEFSAEREGYSVEVLPDGQSARSDILTISPDAGVAHWFDEMNNNRSYPRDYFSLEKLTSVPRRLELTINDTLRFDSPGRYTVSVTTHRVGQKDMQKRMVLTTNSVTFEVQPMSESDEAKEVKRLADLLATKRDWQGEAQVAKQLSYLTGEPSTREKVKRFVSPDQRSGNYLSEIWAGLYIARDRALVLKLIEAALRDPNIPATTQIVQAATRLKILLTDGIRENAAGATPFLEPDSDPRTREVGDAYIVDLAAGLSKRTGNSQTTTAMTILAFLPKDPQSAGAAMRELRPLLIQQFDTLSIYGQESLLGTYWEQLRDPALVPSLKKMLAPGARMLREVALKRLIELAPDEARPYIIAEIRDPGSVVDPKLLGGLSDESLPELDTTLLDQIRNLSTTSENFRYVFLRLKLALLVRYATPGIYQELMELYRGVGTKLPRDGRAGFLAYFAKHNEQEGITLIEQAVSEMKSEESAMLLSDLTVLHYSESIGKLVKKYLETDDPPLASYAAYVIGLHGGTSDREVLEARLKRWREDWGNRVAQADAEQQGRIERELIDALVRGKAWKLSDQRVRELTTGCVTQLCKQSNQVR